MKHALEQTWPDQTKKARCLQVAQLSAVIDRRYSCEAMPLQEITGFGRKVLSAAVGGSFVHWNR
jgi:hypothetical protein